ncbi:MAG: cysteine desulfurase NifS [Clostridia bacterium]|nr:cysteine desulfurase NifS [Clostridia bacterium]
MKRIYMDNAATTRITPPVLEAMMPYLTDIYGNPSSIHAFGREARRALETARAQVAAAINAKPSEIYFTGCGTEADNWAVRGTAYAQKRKGSHIITSAIEHHAILHTCQQLEREGFTVTYVPVDEMGIIKLDELEKAITPETTLITVMAANNEIGTIQPIEEIGKIAKAHGIRFHTDAVQAIGAIPIDVQALGVDMLSMSGHKFHAPKGVGALYVRSGVRLQRFMQGGAQERTQRAGTENLASIVAMGKAIELATSGIEDKAKKLIAMRDRLMEGIVAAIPECRVNGHPTQRLPGNCNVSIRYIEGEALLLSLDLKGIAASSGSACTSGSLDPSHVLLAIGLPHEIAHGSLRFSLSEENTMDEVEYVIENLKEIVQRLRNMSPLTPEALVHF